MTDSARPGSKRPVIAMVGQPNCGKSTLFNAVAGYRAIASNYPGTTVALTRSLVKEGAFVFELVDLPGTYALAGCEPHEKIPLQWLFKNQPELVINVIDASILSRSLEMTLELMELGMPFIVALNMLDEAKRKGIEIDIEKLSLTLGLPVIGCVASKGVGIHQLFQAAQQMIANPRRPKAMTFSEDVEQAVGGIEKLLGPLPGKDSIPSERFRLLKLMEGDARTVKNFAAGSGELAREILRRQEQLKECHGREAGEVICSERHALALNLFEKAARVRPRAPVSLAEKIDYWLMHKYLGYLFMVLILFVLFFFVFYAGKFIETPLVLIFDRLRELLRARLGAGLLATVALGLVQGIAGGVGIVLPYLIPFLLGLGLLEDIGYLPRAAFLMDSFMHKIGLHGKAVVPFVLGYGCSVPALIAVHGTMESKRERLISAILITMIPCSARTTIIFGLAAYLLGPEWALIIYLFNLFVIALIGKLLARFMPDTSEGLIMEVPGYKAPSLKILPRKIWFRLREFIVIAWPILIAGSVILSLMEYFNLEMFMNRALSPIVVYALGLPQKIGVTLVFGVLRKELTLVMLAQALGSSDFLSALTPSQIVVFVVFVVFYVPCLSTLSVLWKILGWRGMLGAALANLLVALVSGIGFRVALAVIGY